MTNKTFTEHAIDDKKICCFCGKLITSERRYVCDDCWGKK